MRTVRPRTRGTKHGAAVCGGGGSPAGGGGGIGTGKGSASGEATGVNTIMRNIGSAVGAQIAGSMIAAHVLASGLPQNAGFEIAFLISAGGALVAALSVLLIPGRGREVAAEAHTEAALSA